MGMMKRLYTKRMLKEAKVEPMPKARPAYMQRQKKLPLKPNTEQPK